MAGTIPLARKLGLKPGHVVVVLGKPPAGFVKALALPDGARLYQRLRPGPIDVLVYFVDRVAELERRFANLTGRMHPDGGLWVAWPKKASKVPTDITEELSTLQDNNIRLHVIGRPEGLSPDIRAELAR